MPYVKKLHRLLTPKLNLLIIKGSTRFAQTFRKISSQKNSDLVWVARPIATQMAAVLLARLTGKKFIWIQAFANPPTPNFLTRILLSQADRIIVSSKKDVARLKNLGIAKTKIRYQR